MINFKELKEEHGAGDWGTDQARKKLQKDTPGQGITDIAVKNKERKESVEFLESEHKVIKVVGDDIKNMKKNRVYGTFPATDKGRDQATMFQLKLKRQKGVEANLVWESLNEVTDFRSGDTVYQVGSKLRGKVLHKGNRDQIFVKFGSITKSIPASELRLAESSELDELSPVTKIKAAIARGVRGPSKKATPTWARETGKAAKELKKRAAQKAEYEKKKKAMQQRGALTSFKVREEIELEEKLKVSDGLGAWIKDFQDSDAPQFKDADSKKRRDMAIAAFTAAGGKLDEGAVAVSTVEKEIRSNGGTRVKKDDRSITFTLKGAQRKVPVDRGFVQDRYYMQLQKMFEEVKGKSFKDFKHSLEESSRRVTDIDVEQGRRDVAKAKTDLEKAKLDKKIKDVKNEGSETWEAGYKRRVVKTTKPEHKEKGYNWRIKGKDRPEISIKLYKDKPSFKEFTKQMKRVAGHEFGG